jgi:uncharacterized protein (TIGR02145 family)
MPTNDLCEWGILVKDCKSGLTSGNMRPSPANVRNNISGWNLSSSIPDFEKFVNNYWSTYYGFGGCDAKKAGEIKDGPGGKKYICKDKAWEKATKYEIEFGLCSKEGEIKEAEVADYYGNKKKEYFICKDKAWTTATDYEIDTYQWVCSKSDEIKTGQITGRKYTCKNNVWIIASKCLESKSCQTFTDTRDNQQYHYVKIGEQTWMAENLNYNATGSKCYDNKPANCEIYGRLYNFETAKKVCPSGWHLPSGEEWDLIMDSNIIVAGSYSLGYVICDDSGCKEKLNNSTDDYGFSALFGGYYNSGFSNIGRECRFWDSSSSSSCGGFVGLITICGSGKGDSDLNSVRCVKD